MWVELMDERVVEGVCDEPKGDPGSTLSRLELEEKFRRLVGYAGWNVPGGETEDVIAWYWGLGKGETGGSCMVPGLAGIVA